MERNSLTMIQSTIKSFPRNIAPSYKLVLAGYAELESFIAMR